MLKSYIMPKADVDTVFEWAVKQDFMGRWMPEPHEMTQVFLGEYCSSPAFDYHNRPYYNHEGWTRGYNDRIPKKVVVTTDQYLWEGGYDCSIDEAIHIHLPCQFLVENIRLSWNGVEGYFFDSSGELIAFDPSLREHGSKGLLINREKFLSFLKDNKLAVLWTLLGEKNIFGGRYSREEWKGHLEVSGAFRILKNTVHGKVHSKFISKEGRESSSGKNPRSE